MRGPEAKTAKFDIIEVVNLIDKMANMLINGRRKNVELLLENPISIVLNDINKEVPDNFNYDNETINEKFSNEILPKSKLDKYEFEKAFLSVRDKNEYSKFKRNIYYLYLFKPEIKFIFDLTKEIE